MMNSFAVTSAFAVIAAIPFAANAQTRAAGFPSIPTPFADSAEIALAVSAAPAPVSGAAAVYAVNAGKVRKLRDGTNGCACMVSRDSHAGSLYPICFDTEGTKTNLQRELMENSMRSLGKSEALIKSEIADAYRRGSLKHPTGMTVAYMMSPRQMLFSSPEANGTKVGPWWPHLMIAAPDLSAASIGLRPDSLPSTAPFSVDVDAGHLPQLIVRLPTWSDGTPARPVR